MGHRLTKIYTRTGDDGSTGLSDGSRVSKDSLQMEVIGDLDELSCCLGLVLAQASAESACQMLSQVQHKLFDIGAAISGAECSTISNGDIALLEQTIDGWNKELPALREFILPGGGIAAARCHLARAVCRRLERHMVAWMHTDIELEDALLCYINRLSDVLFVLCRVLSREQGMAETQWKREI